MSPLREPRVAFQGVAGAFSELAIRQQWPQGATALPCPTFPATLARVVDGEADFAVVPVENAIIGPVVIAQAALDAVGDRLTVRTELKVPVHLCLMAVPGARREALREVYSHPAALGQCRIFFARHAELIPCPHEDTAGAARDVALWQDPTRGAVASQAAALQYGLRVFESFIEDMSANWTRFLVVGRND